MEGITSPPLVRGNSPSSFFAPLLISMLGIVVTSLAILAYHFLLVKYCLRRHRRSTTAVAAQRASGLQPPAGIDEKVLKTIPIFAFSAVKRDTDGSEECVVCLGELEEDDVVRLLPNCNHAFHVGCIDRWLAAHTSCPLCRSPIHEPTNEAQSSHPATDHDSNRGAESSESRSSASGTRPEPQPPPPLQREQPFGLLRHCASLVLLPPPPQRPPSLKRSLSMDQRNVERENCWSASASASSSSILTRSGSYSARPMRHLDRVSSKWLRSFSRLRVGRGGSNAATILPY